MSWEGSIPLMKVIDLQEAKANLEQYAVEYQTSPVVVTQAGQPIFELLPIRPDDS
jgi:prevent-host-death family protein